jgi:transcription antitermination factor NusG
VERIAMPILAAEVDVFPNDLLTRDEFENENGARWWAVYTRSRREKELSRALLTMEIPFYCPMVPHRYRSSAGRIRTSHLPVFTNYVFMFADGLHRYQVLKTNLISNTIEVTDGLQLVHDLRQIQRLIQLGQPISLESQLKAGRKVRIKSGPLFGMEGTILKRQGADFLFVAVNFLQQGALIKLEGNDVEVLM